jgi:hypothetical protein
MEVTRPRTFAISSSILSRAKQGRTCRDSRFATPS